MARGKYKKCGVKTKPKSSRKCDADVKPKSSRKCDADVKPKSSRKCDADVKPKSSRKCDADVKPKSSRKCDADVKPKSSRKCDADGKPKSSRKCDADGKPKSSRKCDADVKPKSSRKCDSDESSPNKRFEDSGPKKRGRPSRSYQNQNVSCSTPGILDEENSPKKKFEDSGPKKRGRPPRSYQNQNVSSSTPGILDEENSPNKRFEDSPKKRGKPSRSYQNKNVSCSTPGILDEESVPKKRGRPRSCQTQNVLGSATKIIHQENNAELRRGRKRKNESGANQDSTEDVISKKRTRSQGITKGKQNQAEVQYVNCDLLSEEDSWQENIETSGSAENDYPIEDLIKDPLNSSQNIKKCEIPMERKYEIKEEEEEIIDTDIQNSFENEEPTVISHLNWPQVIVLCNDEKPVSTSSAAIDNKNVETGDFAVDVNLNTSEGGKHALPDCVLTSSDVFCNLNGPFEDSTDQGDLGRFQLTGGGLLVPLPCNNEKPITSSSAAIACISIRVGDFTVDEKRSTSEARKQPLPTNVLLNYEEPISPSSDDLSNGPFDDSADHVDVDTFEVTEGGLLVPVLCNNDKAISTSSANNCNINGGFEGFAVDENLSISEAGENILPVSLHSDGISHYEDSVVEAMVTGAFQGLNSDTDKLGVCKGLVDGVRLFVKIQKKDPTILSLGACFSTDKLYIVLDTIKEMSENYEQFVSHDSFIESLSWFFTTAGTEVIKDAIRNSKSEEEKNTKTRDVTIFLEVLKNNWKNISLMKKNSQASKSLKSPINRNTDIITSNNTTQSLEIQSSSRSLSNANGNCSMRKNTPPTIVSLVKVGQHDESAEAMLSQENPLQQEVFNQDSGRINTPENRLNIRSTLTNLSEKESTNPSTLCGKTQAENEIIVQVQDNSAKNNTSSCKKRRRWCRRNYCMFCKKLVTNFTRHVFRIHSKIEEVIKYKALPKNKDSKKERMEIFNELRLKSNSIYNKEVLKDSKLGNNIKDLLLTRGRAENGGSYIICSFCKGVFRKPSFSKHKCFKTRPSKNQDNSDNKEAIGVKPFRISNFGFELAPNENDSFVNDGITRMLQNNSDTQMALNDVLMLSVVRSHQRKHQKKKSKAFEQYTFKKIKLGCNFLVKLKEKDCSIHQLYDCLVPSKKDVVCETIKSMCKFDETTGRIGISSMPSRLLIFMRDATSQALKDVLLDQLPSNEKKTAIMQSTDEIMSVLQKMILLSKSQTETVENPPSEDSSTTGVNNDAVILLENVLPAFVELTDSKTHCVISETEDDSPNNANSQGSIATNLGAKIISSKNNTTVVSEELPVKPLSKTMDSSEEPLSCDISLSREDNLGITKPPNEDSSMKTTDEPSSISFEQETASEKKCIYLGRTEAVQFSTGHNLSRIDNTLIEHKQYSNENLTDTMPSSLQTTSNKNSDPLRRREKRCYCIYCKKLVTNFSRHVQRRHKNEEKVIQINNLIKNSSKDYRAELREIRTQGNHVHDQKLLTDLALQDSTQPTIFLNYRRAKAFNGKLQGLVTCTFCKGIFRRTSFFIHIKNCYSKKKQDSKNKQNEHGSEVEFSNSCKNESLDNNSFENKSVVHLNSLKNKLPLENCNHQNAAHNNIIEQLTTKLSTENLVCSQQGFLPEKVTHDLPKITQCPRRPSAMNAKHSTLRQSYTHSQLNKASAKSYCLYCKKSVPKFIQHVLARHRDKEPIIQYMALLRANNEENKTKRRKIIRLLQLKNKKTYFRKYLLNRPSKKISLKFPNQRSLKLSNTQQNMIKEEDVPNVREDISEYGNEGLIEKGKTSNSDVLINNVSHEITTTVSTKEKKRICFLREYASPLIPPPSITPLPQASTKLRDLVLPRLKIDHASMVALNDTLLVATASRALERMYTKSKDNGFNSVTHLIRDGGKLLMCAQSLDKTITEFRDLLKSSKVNTVFAAAKEMCGLDEKSGRVKFINMPFRITYVINQAAAQCLEEVLNNSSLNENDKMSTKKDIDEFLELKRTKFRSIITRWPASKKPRKNLTSNESDEESNDECIIVNSTRTEISGMNKRAKGCGNGIRVTKRRKIYSSSESEENSFDESDREDNPILEPGNEGKKSQRKNLTSDNCYNDSLPKEASLISQKKRWTEKQKRIVILEFQDFIINGTNPGRRRCRELIASTEELTGRTADQVNLIIDNINKGKLKMPSEFEYLKSQCT